MSAEEPRLRFQIRARYEELRLLRERFRHFTTLTDFPLGESGADEILLALDEAATNILRHGYQVPSPEAEVGETFPGIVDVEYSIEGHQLLIRIWDDGVPREEESFESLPPRTPGESGMGLEIMRHIMDELSFERTEEGRNLLVMRRSRGDSDWSKLE